MRPGGPSWYSWRIDPYADVLRSSIHYLRGDRAGASGFATKAIGAEPTLQLPYWTLVRISLDERQHAETARLLIRIEEAFGVKFGDLGPIAEYAEFVKSPEYAEWLKRKKKK